MDDILIKIHQKRHQKALFTLELFDAFSYLNVKDYFQVNLKISSRLVVVCLPLSSFLISFVSDIFCPCKQLIRVDFPTPDDPMNAVVLPLERNLFKDLYHSSEVLVVISTSTPKEIVETSLSLISMSLHKSDFVRTITGTAPLSQAIER